MQDQAHCFKRLQSDIKIRESRAVGVRWLLYKSKKNELMHNLTRRAKHTKYFINLLSIQLAK